MHFYFRMILYDYNGRRLTKPELLSPSPYRKMTYRGIPYKEGYYNPRNYSLRAKFKLSRNFKDYSRQSSTNSTNQVNKMPTIYLSESKLRRWMKANETGSNVRSPYGENRVNSTASSVVALSPVTPSTPGTLSLFTPSPPCTPHPFFFPLSSLALKPIKFLRDKATQASRETFISRPSMSITSDSSVMNNESSTAKSSAQPSVLNIPMSVIEAGSDNEGWEVRQQGKKLASKYFKLNKSMSYPGDVKLNEASTSFK